MIAGFSRRAMLAVAASALLFTAAPAKAVESGAGARAFVQKLADDAMETVAVKGLTNEERALRFRTLFVDRFDLQEISKLVLARYWRAAGEEQRQEFIKLFEDIQVYTWARRFRDYSGETLEIFGVGSDGEDDLLVQSQIKREALSPINVAWRVRSENAVLRIIDIKVEGASMALTHRSEYTSVIQQAGGKIDGLLAIMRKKVEQLKAE